MSARLYTVIALGFIALGSGAAPRAAHAGAPYSEAELKSSESADEAKIRELRQDEITQLRIALGRRSPGNRRADLYLRLAEIYLEAYRADYLLEGRAHEKRLERGQPDKGIDHSRSRPHLLAGIQACKEILSFRIPYPKLDQVHYFMGFNYTELGDREQGLKHFETLTRQFPSSPYVGEAYKEMADTAFDGGGFRKAQAYYELAAKHANADSQPRILHRLAWSYFRTRQHERAVTTLKQAVAATQKSGEKYLNLREEALRDMAVFMTETGQVDEAIRYFGEVAGDKQFYPKVLERLGKQYERNVEPVKATQVYESLLKTSPGTEAGFRVRVKLVDLDLRRGRFKEALARIQGVALPKGGESETQAAAQNLRAMVRRTATEHHEKFRKQGGRAGLETAESYYTAYLETFLAGGKDDPRNEAPEIRMYLADVKRELGKPRESSELYRAVLESKDKRYAKEAGALWTASLSDAIRKQAKAAPGAGKGSEPSPLELEFIDAADRLAEALGQANEGRESALRAAEVLAGYRETQADALRRARRIVESWPRTSQAVTAARLQLQVLAGADSPEGKSESELRETLKDLRANEELMAYDAQNGGKLRAQIGDQELRLKIGVIAKNEKSNDFEAAARNYETFAGETQDRALAEKAFANATANYLKLGDPVSVSRVTARWLARFPRSPKAVEALRGAGTRFLVGGDFASASSSFLLAGREGGDPESLLTASRIEESLGQAARAQALMSSFIQGFPKHPQRLPVQLSLARSLEASKQDSAAAAAYKACLSGIPGGTATATEAALEAECGSRLADLYARNQDLAQAKALYRKVAGLGSRSTASDTKGARGSKGGKTAKKASKRGSKKDSAAPATGPVADSPYVGYARFRLAELKESEARFDRLAMPEASLKRALNQRLEFLEPLSAAYLSAVEAGGPWAVAALSRLANWAKDFADELDGIVPPAGADPEAIARFRRNLAQVSGPLRAKAVATWSDAYTKALALEALSPALPEIADHLADAKSKAVGRAQGYRGRLRLAGLASDGGEAGKAAAMENVRGRLGRAAAGDAGAASAWVDYGNLLWGEGHPGLARMAYDRALALDPRNPAALNNRGVVLLSDARSAAATSAGGLSGEEDWASALEANALFRAALAQDDFFLPAKMNRAMVLNYFRLFEKAKPLWDQVLVRAPGADAQDGLAIALQGTNQSQAAEAAFARAREAGAPKGRFAAVYHDAARSAVAGAEGAERCLDRLGDLDPAALAGFEKDSVDRLRRTCTLWKSEAKANEGR